MKEIKVKIKNIYGIDKPYPACDVSRMLCEIAGTKILTDSILRTISKNGYKITPII